MKPDSVSTKQERIAQLARQNPAMAFTSLNHYLDAEWMEYAYERTRQDGAVGPGGHLKFPHPWPGQNPPRDSGEMPG